MAGGTRSFEFSRRLAKSGHEVTVITSCRNPGRNSSTFISEEGGVRVVWLPVSYSNEMNFARRALAFINFAIRSLRYCLAYKADVIIATSTPLTVAIPAIITSKLKRVPYVFEVRDLWPELPIAMGALTNPILRLCAITLERMAYSNAAQLIALSPGMKQGIEAVIGLKKKVTVIPNSCDIELFNSNVQAAGSIRALLSKLNGRPYVLYAGTLGLINGVKYAVELADMLRKADDSLCIVIVGDGAERNSVLELAAERGVLNENLFLLYPVPKEQVVFLFRQASLGLSLFINLREMEANSANKFFDSIAAGKPIAINYGGWQAALIASHKIGVCLDPLDHAKAAAQLRSFVRCKDGLSEAGRNASDVAKTMFDREKLAAEFAAVVVESARA